MVSTIIGAIELIEFESIYKRSHQETTREYAYYALEKAIVTNKLPPGAWLSEELLSSKLNVSRTPLREALLKLQNTQLIERGNNGRLFVKELTVKEASDIYAVRQALEDLVLVQAAENMNDLSISLLFTVLEKMKLADRSTDVGERGKEFHDTLATIANNEVTKSLLVSLQPRFDRYRYVSTSTGKKRTSKAINEHEEIFVAIKENKIETARHLMKEHLNNSKLNVIETIRNL
jgi:DNA-binding GntR family transcriptional regulator